MRPATGQGHGIDSVLFDLDGTLVDSAPDLAAAMNHVLGLHGRPPLPTDSVRDMVGEGARRLIEKGMAATGGWPRAAVVETMLEQFLEHYHLHIADSTRPFPGAEELLSGLQDAGYKLALCTNKPQALTESLMRGLGLERYFSVMLGGDAVPACKPAPDHLLAATAALAGRRALLVGDSITDVRAARAAGMPVLVVRHGYSRQPLETLGADAIIGRLEEVDAWLTRHGQVMVGS